METCALNILNSSVSYKFVVCLEEFETKYGGNFDKTATYCASQFGINTTAIYTCMNTT